MTVLNAIKNYLVISYNSQLSSIRVGPFTSDAQHVTFKVLVITHPHLSNSDSEITLEFNKPWNMTYPELVDYIKTFLPNVPLYRSTKSEALTDLPVFDEKAESLRTWNTSFKFEPYGDKIILTLFSNDSEGSGIGIHPLKDWKDFPEIAGISIEKSKALKYGWYCATIYKSEYLSNEDFKNTVKPILPTLPRYQSKTSIDMGLPIWNPSIETLKF